MFILEDVGVAAGVQDRMRRNRGACAADFDTDGDVDLYLANPADPATLLLNQGDGTFAEQPDAPTTGTDTACAAADLDNDGDPDLLVTCGGWIAACADRLYRNDGVVDGAVVLTDVSEAAGIGLEERPGFGAAVADYDRDGFLDVFVSNKNARGIAGEDTRDQLYRNNADGTFTDVAEELGLDGDGDNHQAAWLDADGDGDLDLFVPTLQGDNHLYRSSGDGTFTEDTPEALRLPHQAFGSAAADLNNDGRADLVVSANSLSGWLSDDQGEASVVFISTGSDFIAIPLSTGQLGQEPVLARVMGFQIGDLDMDGQIDLFFGTGEPRQSDTNWLLLNRSDDDGLWWEDATALIDHAAPEDGGSEDYPGYPYRTHGTVMFDADGDGAMDLFVGNGGMDLIPDQHEPNRLFVGNLRDDVGSLQLTLVGTASNRDGVGARVTVVSDSDTSRPVVRFVLRSTGFNASVPRTQLIGLGDRQPPYTVTVDWPLGATLTVSVAASGESITLEEPAR